MTVPQSMEHFHGHLCMGTATQMDTPGTLWMPRERMCPQDKVLQYLQLYWDRHCLRNMGYNGRSQNVSSNQGNRECWGWDQSVRDKQSQEDKDHMTRHVHYSGNLGDTAQENSGRRENMTLSAKSTVEPLFNGHPWVKDNYTGSLLYHNSVLVLGHVSKVVSILLSKLSDCPNTDTLLCYYNYPFLTVYIRYKDGLDWSKPTSFCTQATLR